MNKEQIEILKTVFIVVAITLCLVWFLAVKSDVLTGEKERYYERYYSRAEFICWSTGSFEGVDSIEESSEGYDFTCKEPEMKIEYDIITRKGWIKHE